MSTKFQLPHGSYSMVLSGFISLIPHPVHGNCQRYSIPLQVCHSILFTCLILCQHSCLNSFGLVSLAILLMLLSKEYLHSTARLGSIAHHFLISTILRVPVFEVALLYHISYNIMARHSISCVGRYVWLYRTPGSRAGGDYLRSRRMSAELGCKLCRSRNGSSRVLKAQSAWARGTLCHGKNLCLCGKHAGLSVQHCLGYGSPRRLRSF